MEVIPQGVCHVRLKSTGHHYSWRKITTCVHNIIVGKLYVDHYGDMLITNHTTGDQALLNFKARGWGGRNEAEIVGSVFEGAASDNRAKLKISGRWNDRLTMRPADANDESAHPSILWKRHPLPENAAQNWNLTSFAMTLNEKFPGMEKDLPISDARLRPDQGAMER